MTTVNCWVVPESSLAPLHMALASSNLGGSKVGKEMPLNCHQGMRMHVGFFGVRN